MHPWAKFFPFPLRVLIIHKHWCSIFIGVAIIIVFFFMEETNFYREELSADSSDVLGSAKQATSAIDTTETTPDKELQIPNDSAPDMGIGSVGEYTRKPYLKKLKLWSKTDASKKPHWKGMVLRPLIYMSFPVVFFSGFMYGAVICYFNVLNGTASLILSSPPYNFQSSMVGLTYISSVIGVFIG